jgi:ATP-binding cassette subfamily C protein CydD
LSPERRLLKLSRPALTLLTLAVGAGFFAGALFSAQAILLSGVVNRVFLLGQTLADVLPLLGLMLALLLLRASLIWAQEVLAQRSASRVKGGLRQQLLAHFYALGPAYTQTERSGELVNAAVQGVEALDEYVTQFLPARYLAGLVPAFVLLVVFLLDPWTTLVLLFAGPMLLLLLALIGGQAKALTERRFLELSWMSAFFLDVLQGIATLKMFGRSREQAANIEEISRHYGKTTMEVLATAFQTSLMMEWAATAATAMVALEVSLRLMSGALPFDRALAVLLLTPEFFLPLRQMAIKYHSGTTGKAAAGRIYAILDTPLGQRVRESEDQRSSEPIATALQYSGTTLLAHYPTHSLPQHVTSPPTIRFEEVRFAYDQGQRPALHGFSLEVPRGQTVALVGPTGAGKTTVVSLLLRFVEPDAGQITVDGRPVREIEPALWRRRVAWVPQLPHLFHGTVADNIRLARPDATPDQVVAAACAAHADEFICALPQGYDTPLGEQGARLSGGQRQRLAIARAFLKDAPVLILDEATASLDARSDALIRDALARLTTGRTVLVIAHRLELTYTADQVVVLDAGRAVETGTYESLLAQGGLYRQLVESYANGER